MTAAQLSLPVDAALLLPHEAPMIQVDQLLEFGDGSGLVSAVIGADNVFVTDDGCLEEVALMEIMAQAYAAIKGYDDTINGRPVRKGFLVGGRYFKLYRRPRVGDLLVVEIGTATELDGFFVVDGVISCADEVVAEGSIKLWVP